MKTFQLIYWHVYCINYKQEVNMFEDRTKKKEKRNRIFIERKAAYDCHSQCSQMCAYLGEDLYDQCSDDMGADINP